MSYISLSDDDKKKMLAAVGASSVRDLFCCIPEELRLKRDLRLPEAMSEIDLLRYFRQKGEENRFLDFVSFLGGGAYRHFIPAVVDHLSERGEFVTPYTPYQPEVSQGTLQVIFEFQTLICQLTGMDIANASLYDGASGAAEAVLMAHRLKGRPKVLVARSVHPQYRQAIRTYTRNIGLNVQEIAFTEEGMIDREQLASLLDDGTSVVAVQSPNFFGVVEDLKEISDLAHERQALSAVLVAEPISLGLLEAPGNLGADIVAGEGQSFGIPLGFGGPYLGFMACSKDFIRQFPGRIAGQTQDVEGRTGFVLTLSTREQHIRREKATSNICTNQAWCALRATIFLETLGQRGLREMAEQNVHKTAYALQRLSRVPGLRPRFKGAVFNEFVIDIEGNWKEVDEAMRERKILAGIPIEDDYPDLQDSVLINVTEMHTREEIDRLANSLESVMGTE